MSGPKLKAVQLSESQLTALKQAFDRFDEDGNGKVTTKELGNVLRSLGQNPSEETLKQMISKCDTDGSGTVEFNEFCGLMKTMLKTPESPDDIRAAFKVFDIDGNGSITAGELRHVLAILGGNVSKERCEELVKLVDTDGDGKVSYEEFVDLYFKV
ncbi:neo-calmodulin-like [Glandiceps talaboti]